MNNADLARIINSDEVQSVVKPAKTGKMVKKIKKNPLKNIVEMEKLNPYVRMMRKVEQEQQAARKAKRSETLAAKRGMADKAIKFMEEASKEGEVMF